MITQLAAAHISNVQMLLADNEMGDAVRYVQGHCRCSQEDAIHLVDSIAEGESSAVQTPMIFPNLDAALQAVADSPTVPTDVRVGDCGGDCNLD
jgi:hypothetical protein